MRTPADFDRYKSDGRVIDIDWNDPSINQIGEPQDKPATLRFACQISGLTYTLSPILTSTHRQAMCAENRDSLQDRPARGRLVAHVVQNRVEAAYRRTDLFERRRVLYGALGGLLGERGLRTFGHTCPVTIRRTPGSGRCLISTNKPENPRSGATQTDCSIADHHDCRFL